MVPSLLIILLIVVVVLISFHSGACGAFLFRMFLALDRSEVYLVSLTIFFDPDHPVDCSLSKSLTSKDSVVAVIFLSSSPENAGAFHL